MITDRPRWLNSYAVDRPAMPLPTTATSHRSLPSKGTALGATAIDIQRDLLVIEIPRFNACNGLAYHQFQPLQRREVRGSEPTHIGSCLVRSAVLSPPTALAKPRSTALSADNRFSCPTADCRQEKGRATA